MAKDRSNQDSHSGQGGATAARQAKRELARATRGMSDKDASEAIANNPELSALLETSQLKRGNRTGPRPQGLSPHQEAKMAFARENGRAYTEPKKKEGGNNDRLARRAMRTEQNLARGVDVVVALLSLKGAFSDDWSFRAGEGDEKVSVRAKNGHGKLRGIFDGIGGIPSLPRSALSHSGESIVLQRNGNPRDIVSIPCLGDQNMEQRSTGRQLSRQESEGIQKKIGVHPSKLVEEYREIFGLDGMN